MKKLLGLLILSSVLNASALHIPVVSFDQNNWTYTLTVEPIIGVDGEFAFTVLIDGIAAFAGLNGIAGSSTTDLLPEAETPSNWMLHVGSHTVALTYFEADGDFITSVGTGYTVLQPTGDRPFNAVPDGSSTFALLGIVCLLLYGVGHLRRPSPALARVDARFGNKDRNVRG